MITPFRLVVYRGLPPIDTADGVNVDAGGQTRLDEAARHICRIILGRRRREHDCIFGGHRFLDVMVWRR